MPDLKINIEFKQGGDSVRPTCALCGKNSWDNTIGGVPSEGPVLFNPALLFVDPDGWTHCFGLCQSCAYGAAAMWDLAAGTKR